MIVKFLTPQEMSEWLKKHKGDVFVEWDNLVVYTNGDAINRRAEIFKEMYEDKPKPD